MNQSLHALPALQPASDLVLQDLATQFQDIHLNQLFQQNASRFSQYMVELDQIVYDFSKQRIDHAVFTALIDFAKEKGLEKWIKSLFSEQKINCSEQRAAMHWALRLPKPKHDDPNIAQQVHVQLDRMLCLG